MVALVVLLTLVVLVLAVLVVGLLRSHAEILRRLHELGAGVFDESEELGEESAAGGVTSPVQLADKPDPEIRTRPGVPEPRELPDDAGAFGAVRDLAGVTPAGAAKVVGVSGTGHTTLLAFLSSGCGTCADFWRAFAEGEADRLPGRDTRLVIVTKGPQQESPASVASLAPPGVPIVMSTEAYDDYSVPVSPYFILVDGAADQVVGEGAAASWDQVANLLRQAAADAGLATTGRPLGGSPSTGRLNRDQRESRADTELLAAGITPGHASLYPDVVPPAPESVTPARAAESGKPARAAESGKPARAAESGKDRDD